MKEVIMHAAGINFFYGKHQVLKDIHFVVEKGDFIALTGDNGSGKSTLIQILIGELSPQTGGVQLFGEHLKDFANWQKIGYLSQTEARTIGNFPASVLEIVTANLYNEIGRFRLPGKKHKQRALEALKKVGMENYAKAMPSELSGGQLQRVLLAKALVSKPEFLLLDEPTTAMDEDSTLNLYELFAELHQNGTTFLIITHDTEGIRPYTTGILHLENKVLHKVYSGVSVR